MANALRRQKLVVEPRCNDRDPLVLKSLPTSARPSEGSRSLTDKFVSRLEWMQEKGIGDGLAAVERPLSSRKPPLPGTVIYFSDYSCDSDTV